MGDPPELAAVVALAHRSNAGVQVQVVSNGAQAKNLPHLAHLLEKAPVAQVRYSTHLWLHAIAVLAHCHAEVGVDRRHLGHDVTLEPLCQAGRDRATHLEREVRPHRALGLLLQSQAERAGHRGQLGVAIERLLDVLG